MTSYFDSGRTFRFQGNLESLYTELRPIVRVEDLILYLGQGLNWIIYIKKYIYIGQNCGCVVYIVLFGKSSFDLGFLYE